MFRKIRNAGLALLSVFWSALSCQSEDDSAISVSSEVVELNRSAGYGSFMVLTGDDWTIRVPDEASWCSVYPLSGSGNTEIKLRAEKYSMRKDRSFRIEVMNSIGAVTVTVVQKGAQLALEVESSRIGAAGGTVTVHIDADADAFWSIGLQEGITASPQQGTGSADVRITVDANTINRERNYVLPVSVSDNRVAEIELSQEAGPNTAPEKPVLDYPENGASGISRVLNFMWQPATDADADFLTYVLEYSEDGSFWTEITTTGKISAEIDFALAPSTRYYWRVKAYDGIEYTSSDIYTFTTNDKNMPLDGEFIQYTEGGLTGSVPVIFIGEGFVISDFEEGGHWDKTIDEGIEHFFATEPFRTYRNEFTAYKVAAYSKESGASVWDESRNIYSVRKNTAFDTRYYGDGYTSTLMTTSDSKVFQYAGKVTGITEEVLRGTTIVLVVNCQTYSGTCWMYPDGRSISIVPACGPDAPYTYRQTMAHEAGGHGFGRLADEYIYSNGRAPQSAIDGIIEWSGYGANPNVDVVSDKSQCKWRHFFTIPGYQSVGYYSGAQYRGGGVYMPETSSVMRNMPDEYYNAPSREAIVRRIMSSAGKEFDFDDFIGKDKAMQRSYSPDAHSVRYPEIIAHTPPQYVKE